MAIPTSRPATNHERSLTLQFFKEIASYMPNVDVMHITGTGQIQEQFAHFLAETPQYKDTITSDSTSNKMSDEALLEYFAATTQLKHSQTPTKERRCTMQRRSFVLPPAQVCRAVP